MQKAIKISFFSPALAYFLRFIFPNAPDVTVNDTGIELHYSLQKLAITGEPKETIAHARHCAHKNIII